MAEPLTYQQALESGANWFYWQHDGGGWFLEEISQIRDWRGSNAEDSEFLPIPTPEELLSEVDVEVSADCWITIEDIINGLPDVQPGDRVRVRKVKG